MVRKRIVVFSVLGVTLDKSQRGPRWDRWRPTVALCQQAALAVDRLVLLHAPRDAGLAALITRDIARISPDTVIQPQVVAWKDPWDFAEVYTALLDLVRAYPFDQDQEDYLINITTGTHVAQICWFLLAEARFIPARLLQLSPPSRRDPEDRTGTHAIIDLDLSRYDAIARRFAADRLADAGVLKSGIETRNPAFNALIGELEHVAIRSRAPILLTGPTGTGKTHLAARISALKSAHHALTGPFVEINCATLRGDQAMSTLFGHVRGAFTGAVTARAGVLRHASGGVLFLDEIGELGLDEQAMCLTAIEQKQFLPVGADTPVTTDFQLIAGTNRDLRRAVREGRFREDLLARLDIWTFTLPPLRHRREDIAPNLDYELRRLAERELRSVAFTSDARRAYLDFAEGPEAAWPGNFRDLASSLMRMSTLSDHGRIDRAIVDMEIARLRRIWEASDAPAADPDLLARVLPRERIENLDAFERPQLEAVLRACRASASLSEAGRRLFAVSRQGKAQPNDADRLRKYLARHGLSFEAIRQG